MRIVRVNKGGGIALVSLTCGQSHGFKAAFIHARLLLRGKVNLKFLRPKSEFPL